MLRTNQMKSLSQKIEGLFPSIQSPALIPVAHEAEPCTGRLEFARFNRQSPRRRRYRRSGAATSPAAVKASWF